MNKCRYASTYLLLMAFLCGFLRLPAQVLDFKTYIRIANGKLIEEKSFLIQINNKSSDGLADISIPYSDSDKLDVLEAVVLDANGKEIRSLKKRIWLRKAIFRTGLFLKITMLRSFPLNITNIPI